MVWPVSAQRVWLRSRSFDVGLQLGALAGIAPALLVHAALDRSSAASLLPLGTLVAIPFLHVFGSFFFAFSSRRNTSASPPRQLGALWVGWLALSAALQLVAPRGLATFALLYGGWHILRQNFGFLRELAGRAGLGKDLALRRLDHAACLAPAVALWLVVSARGPWHFLGVEIHHVAVPLPLLILALAAVPATIFLRERRVGRSSSAGLLLLAGNAAALLAPALLLDDLTLIYTLSASFHGIQYLAYLAERERERDVEAHPEHVLLPLASAILLATVVWFGALAVLQLILPVASAGQVILVAWYAIVPFHYFVDGRIWRRRGPRVHSERALA